MRLDAQTAVTSTHIKLASHIQEDEDKNCIKQARHRKIHSIDVALQVICISF